MGRGCLGEIRMIRNILLTLMMNQSMQRTGTAPSNFTLR